MSQQINLLNDSPLSRKMSWALSECVNKVLQQPGRNRGFKRALPLSRESLKEAGKERQFLCGVVSQRAQPPLCSDFGTDVRELREGRCSNIILAKGGGCTSSELSWESWDAESVQRQDLQGQELTGDRWKYPAKGSAVSEMDNAWWAGHRSSVNSC